MAEYESIQADIFDHIFAIVEEFVCDFISRQPAMIFALWRVHLAVIKKTALIEWVRAAFRLLNHFVGCGVNALSDLQNRYKLRPDKLAHRANQPHISLIHFPRNVLNATNRNTIHTGSRIAASAYHPSCTSAAKSCRGRRCKIVAERIEQRLKLCFTPLTSIAARKRRCARQIIIQFNSSVLPPAPSADQTLFAAADS